MADSLPAKMGELTNFQVVVVDPVFAVGEEDRATLR
jgi:hypothetical protein